MITEQAKERCRILAFWERHGERATTEAFHISRRTLFRWQNMLQKAQGKLEGLNAKHTASARRRKRIVPDSLIQRMGALRTLHPRLGKDKLRAILKQEGYGGSTSTIGCILSDLKSQGRFPAPTHLSLSGKTGKLIEQASKRKKKRRRPYGYRVLEVDTIIRFIDGTKRYILTRSGHRTKNRLSRGIHEPRIKERG